METVLSSVDRAIKCFGGIVKSSLMIDSWLLSVLEDLRPLNAIHSTVYKTRISVVTSSIIDKRFRPFIIGHKNSSASLNVNWLLKL